MSKKLQNRAMLNESGAEVVEVVFGLVLSIGLGAAILAVQGVINGMMDSAGEGAANAFNALGEGGAIELDEVTYTNNGAQAPQGA